MAGMNGAHADEAAAPLAETIADPNVVKLFEDGLAMAKAGRIVGCAFVVVFESGKPAVSVGGQFPLSMYYGCDKLKYMLSQSIDGQQQSRILRAGG